MRFNQIFIIDSIPNDEQNTALRLYADVKARAIVFEPAPHILYNRVENSVDFLQLISRLRDCVLETGNYPILHIECHGEDAGLLFADGSFLTWIELKPSLIELNVAMRLNLLVIVAACDGSAITYTVTLEDRAPVWGLIGPVVTVRPDVLEQSLLAFYETLLRTRSAQQAMNALHASAPDIYVLRLSHSIFQYVWDHYQATQETAEARLRRAEELRNLLPSNSTRPSVEEIAELYRVRNPDFFNNCRRLFFMCDLYEEHEQRFSVRYE